MPKLLVVDDEPNVLYSFRKGLSQEGLCVQTAETGQEGLRLIEQERPDAVILDVRLPDMSGLDIFDRIQELDPRLPVIVVTAHSTTETAINAMKRGAFDYLLKPIDIHQLRNIVAKAVHLSRLEDVPAVFDEDEDDRESDRIVGRSAAMQDVYKTIGRIAPEDVTVLILGESGTGKELVARALYHHSRRNQKPFLEINCAALPESLLESELFGHERGAFTGADRRRIGKFEQADGGTLFLDEVGDMSPATQAKVLRILQDGRFERVGGSETVKTDVRVIAATNQDLEAKIESGEFRTDLLYRLNGFTIRLPALRERLDDLPLLVDHFVKRTNQQVSNRATTLAPETMQCMKSYDWPGNVRELQSVIKQCLLRTTGPVIAPEFLPDEIRGGRPRREEPQDDDPGLASNLKEFVDRRLRTGSENLYAEALEMMERYVITRVLRQTSGNQSQASRILGITRGSLRTKIRALNISIEHVVSVDDG